MKQAKTFIFKQDDEIILLFIQIEVGGEVKSCCFLINILIRKKNNQRKSERGPENKELTTRHN